jgi:hypothetical protein
MKKLIEWIKCFFCSHYKIEYVSEFPKEIKKRKIYIEGNSKLNDFWYAKFLCPCGCKDELTLNLINDVSPRWKIENDFRSKKISLTPSINRKSNCKSHFWITDSKVKWC